MATQAQDEPPPRPVGHEQIEGTLSGPRLRFNLPAEIEHLHRQPAWRESSGPSSTTLVKHPDLRVVLVAMRKGSSMPRHRTVARITVQVIAGSIRVRLVGRITEEELLAAGELVVLDRNVEHDVEASEDSAFLLTLAWPTEENCP